jgi:cell division protein FtsW (lipid II flippase)
MAAKLSLTTLFAAILVCMLVCTGIATVHQSIVDWRGLTTGPDRYWTIATLSDAYFGFITFYVWVFYKERRWPARIGWFIAIMALGNMAMATYMLVQLARWRDGEPPSALLAARNG